MTRQYGDYAPMRCQCGPTLPRCPACAAHAKQHLQPGGVREALTPDPEARLVPCGGCGELFALRWSQRGPLARGQAVYCSDACRLIQRRTKDQRHRERRRKKKVV